MKNSYLLLLLFISACTYGQTVGTITLTDEALDGYTFFSPFSGTKAYMVDNCGNLINEWNRGTQPGLAAYFLDNGLMLRTYKADLNGPFTSVSNAGGLELVDWDNNTVWQYEINTPEQLSHHDAVMMPNGNILTLTWELTYRDELIELGRDPNQIATENYMWSEKIQELELIGSDSANVIWEWHINDHYIQDFDQSKSGYGVVSEHPELFNINLPELNSSNSNSTRDWNHFNAIDYNEALDQILISVRNSDEIWILDHTTTTAEAATHEGGTYGKGGDILYRWGNASAYNRAQIADQQLFGQHGVHWIKQGLDDAGKIMIFNNGNSQPGQDFSQVEVLDPPQSQTGFYVQDEDLPFGPELAQSIYGNKYEERFYSAYLSNAQRLPNGNTLINAGSPGRIFEVTPSDDIVWAYEIPLFGDTPANQGQSVSSNANFRAYKFDAEFIGFEGVDLTPGPPIENNPLPCNLNVAIEEFDQDEVHIAYFPSINQLYIIGDIDKYNHVLLWSIDGRKISDTSIDNIKNGIKTNTLSKGLYIVQLHSSKGIKSYTKAIY